MEWLKKILIEKWLGRLIVVGLAALGGYLIKVGFPADAVNNWIEATKAVVEAGIPILIAWLLGTLRYKVALNKLPPAK